MRGICYALLVKTETRCVITAKRELQFLLLPLLILNLLLLAASDSSGNALNCF